MRLPTKIRLVSGIGLFTAVMVVLSFFESLFPLYAGIPGVRLGLSNSVIVLALFIYGFKASIFLTLSKMLFSLVFSGGVSGFLFTAFGSLSSMFGMYFILRLLRTKVSALGLSVAGGFCHITSQYFCAMFIFDTAHIFKIFPVAAAVSVLTSAMVGVICNILLERVYKICV